MAGPVTSLVVTGPTDTDSLSQGVLTEKGIDMKRRSKLRRGKDRKVFSRTAAKTHRKNGMGAPMRGGIRL